MIYVFERGNVVYDGSTLTEKQKKEAVEVEKLPIPERVKGKIALLRANLENKTVYYDYVDEPKSDELEEVKDRVADLFELVLFGGAEQ